MLIATAALAAQVSLAAAFPRPGGYVNDFASILDDSTEASLKAQLTTLEKDTSAEVVVVTVTSLDAMSIEEYANKLFADWGIGKKRQDNGVLLLVAPTDRAVRIEVGYGLEGILPDGLAGEIIRNDIIPEFRANNFPGGVTKGIDRIARVVRKEPGAADQEPGTRNQEPPLLFIIPFLGLFVFIGSFAMGLGLRTRTFGTLIFGGMFGGVPWVFLAVLHSAIAVAILGSLGLAALALGFVKGRSEFWKDTLRAKKRGSSDDGGWQMGSSSGSGGSSGGGSSSGGSSFGGGSSGGGGASGRW